MEARGPTMVGRCRAASGPPPPHAMADPESDPSLRQGDAEAAEVRRIEVTPELAGTRLDVALAGAIPAWSRSRLQAVVKGGGVRVDGRTVLRPNTPLEAGSVVEVALPDPRLSATDVGGAPILALDVLFADEHVIVIDKPAGLVSHPTSALRGGSVADLAEERFGALPSAGDAARAGIVHRLDRLTSGVMVLAASERALEELGRQFRERRVEKTYLAVVHGVPRFDSEWVLAPMVAHPRSPDRQRIAGAREIEDGEAREAETLVELRESFTGFALVACKPRTGRTHQIRLHLQHLGHPIVGDRIYHPRGALAIPLAPQAPRPARQALHSSEIAFAHPVSGERLRFEAPLPADMRALVEWLRGAR